MRLRIAYSGQSQLAADVQQMAHGGVLVRDPAVSDVDRDAPVELELVMPDGTTLRSRSTVIQVLAGVGVAVTVEPAVIEEARHHVSGVTPAPRAQPDELTNAQKIQLALHGTRDQRNAILRDRNRTLHVYVLRNPGINIDDVTAIAKNPQMGQEMFKQIADRPDWMQRPQVATALARNPKVPADIAVRALAYVPVDTLRQLAKGTGAPPHVVQAARKRVVGK